MGIGDRLREARELAGLPARELDRLADKTLGHAGLIESRRRSDAQAGTLKAYADVLGLSLDWLIAGRGKLPSQARVKAAVEAARAKKLRAA